MKQKQDQPPTDSCMTETISMEEVELAIRQLKYKKAPGPDGVTNDMIKNVGLLTKRTLLKLFNGSWKTGTVPAMWENATMIPTHKKEKHKKNPKQLSTYQSSELLRKTTRKSDQQKSAILLRRQQSSVTNTNWIQKAQKHGRSGCSYCPRDSECIPIKEDGCRRLL